MNDLSSIISSSLSNQILHLTIFPTEACNFRCVYCYETFRLGRMDRKTIEGLKRFFDVRIPELNFLHISWFGGEPLLALDIIEELSIHIYRLLEHNPQCRFEADMTTNAWGLTVPVFEQLCRFNVKLYQISFDGPKAHHDTKRLQANGMGTFDRIWENLLALKKTAAEVSFLVRLHLDKDNTPQILPFIEQYRAAFGDDQRFRLFFRPLSRLGGSRDEELKIFHEEEGDVVVQKLANYAQECQLLNKTAEEFPKVCYAAKLNSFVIRADGTLGKCTVALESEYNCVGVIRKNGTLKIDKRKLLKWVRGMHSGDERELFCPLEHIVAS